jgi:hypothetical protein
VGAAALAYALVVLRPPRAEPGTAEVAEPAVVGEALTS